MTEKKLNCAAVVFFDKENGKAVLQKVGPESKYGDKQHFFGGKMEAGETPYETVMRELSEELEYKPEGIMFWKKFEYRIDEKNNYFDGWDITMNMFVAPISSGLLSSPVHEGEGMLYLKYEEALGLEGWGKNNKIIFAEFMSEFF
jgi:8-oxo-dGTP pyrophosphatase MutT (NUDIX family)